MSTAGPLEGAHIERSRSGPVVADSVLYIKLGSGGLWERECVRNGTLRLGYEDLPHDMCLEGRWEQLIPEARKWSKDQGAATRHVKQVQSFYEAPTTTLWITFHGDCLYWCFADAGVTRLEDGTKLRQTRDGWHCTDVRGRALLKAKLSGKVLAVQGFQGTICSLSEGAYLLHKINGTVAPHLATAQDALDNLQSALVPLIRSLHHKDFEVFTDLIFRQAGWQRTGVVGEVEKDIDLDLISPLTGERIAVQVKSSASSSQYVEYRQRYADMRGFTRFYFITGLVGWLLDKAS